MSFDNTNTPALADTSPDASSVALNNQAQGLHQPLNRDQPVEPKTQSHAGDDHHHSIIIKKDDTLSDIAYHHLGKSASLHDVYSYVNQLGKANHIKDVDKIYPGQAIHMPRFEKSGDHANKVPKSHKLAPAEAAAPAAKPEPKVTPSRQDAPLAVVKPEAAAVPHSILAPPAADASAPASGPGAQQASVKPDAAGAPIKQGAAPTPATEVAPATPLLATPGNIEQRESPLGAIGSGMVSEVTEHPYSVAAGLGIGVIGSVAARVLPGWARAGLLVGGAAYGLYEAYTHKDQINQVIDVEADPLGHSVAERQASIDTLHGLGRGATDLTAAVAGGAIGGLTGMVLRGETSGVIDSMLSKIGIGKGPLFERTPPLGKVFSPTPENPFMTTLSAEKGAPGMPLPGNDNIAGLPRPFVALTAPPERLALPAPSERGGLPALAEQPGLPVVTERSGLPALTEQPGLPVVTERSGLPALTEQPGLPVPTERAVLAGAPEADAPSQPPKQLALPAPPRLLALPAPSH